MGILKIAGLIICIVSGAAIWKTMSALGRASERRLKAFGAQEPIPTTLQMRAYVAAIHIAFGLGVGLLLFG